MQVEFFAYTYCILKAQILDLQALKVASRVLQIELIHELQQKIETLETKIEKKDEFINELKTENHASEVQTLYTKLEECKESNNMYQNIIRKNQQTIKMEAENVARLEKTQSETMSSLLALTSYAANSTIAYETTSDGNIVPATTCSCLPQPNIDNLTPVSLKYKCDNIQHTEFHVECSDQDQGCLNSHWPSCSLGINNQTEEDILEWSAWSQPEIKMLRRRNNRTGIIQQVEKTGKTFKNNLTLTYS